MDEMELKYVRRWERDAHKLGRKEKDEIAILFITKILGLSDSIARIFRDGVYDPDIRQDRKYSNAQQTIGLRQNGYSMGTDTRPFWEEIRKRFPERYSEDDVNYLSQGVFSPGKMLFTMDDANSSPLLAELRINAHAFK